MIARPLRIWKLTQNALYNCLRQVRYTQAMNIWLATTIYIMNSFFSTLSIYLRILCSLPQGVLQNSVVASVAFTACFALQDQAYALLLMFILWLVLSLFPSKGVVCSECRSLFFNQQQNSLFFLLSKNNYLPVTSLLSL